MQNLLPEEEKKKVLTEYRLRLGVVILFATGTLVAISLILLAPSYILAISKNNFVSDELAKLELKETSSTQEKDVATKIKEVNKKITLFLGDQNGTPLIPSVFFMKIIDIKTPAIKITGFSYDATALRARVVVTGHADDRDSLAKFLDDLKNEKTFTKADLPISSYVKSTNIDFSIVLERAPGGTTPQK